MKTIYFNKYKNYNDVSVNLFPEINNDIREITIYGNSENLFGSTKLVNNIGNNLKRLGWLIKAIQNKISFIIAGDERDKKYFEDLTITIKEKYNLLLNYSFINFKEYKLDNNNKSYYNKSYHYKRDFDMKNISKNSDITFRCYIKRNK